MTVALTGGIGSGKSHVARLLAERGIEVYDCDAAAKRLIRTSPALQRRLSEAVGQEVFPHGRFDKALLSRFIVASQQNALAVDGIVHPAVADDFAASGLEWFESAILFESGFAERLALDCIVAVTAPETTRIERIMCRDNITRQQAVAWIRRQLPDEEKARGADFVIENDGAHALEPQIDAVLAEIRKQTTRQTK